MNYYEVIPADKKFHGREPLTYHYASRLQQGQIVAINLRNHRCLGIVSKEVSKPEFNTAGIDSVVEEFMLPSKHLELLKWMLDFYPGSAGSLGQLFLPSFLDKNYKPETEIITKKTVSSASLPALTSEQIDSYRAIKDDSSGNRTYVLQGITGSGKTRLYIELAIDSLKKKKSAIILTPEISLTAPIAKQFKDIFGDQVAVNHSSLTPKQRRVLWSRTYSSKQPMIIIGPRSSLFLPLSQIGLIVVDEFHEPAYKQGSRPFYHANRVSSMLAKLSSAKIIFGSATPPINDFYLATLKKVPIIKLDRLAVTGKKPAVNSTVINLLDNNEKSKYPLISQTLISNISSALEKGEQSLLFINKRGSARSISCQDCGKRELCKNCDLPMVYHSDQHLVRCHTCGFSKIPPNKCPKCGSTNIYFSSPGTKAITDSLSKIFPSAKIARFDKDNKKSEKLENIYGKVINDIDIIVGTQIIAKGHDLPRLSVVAMLLADSELDFPDFSSSERAYQLIRQLSGRINRGHRRGIFIVQTFNPYSKSIVLGLKGDWDEFYNNEITQRRKHGFPPFYSALKIESARSSAKSAEASLDRLINKIGKDFKGLEILGPSPSFVEKKASKWHWQVLLRSKSRSELASISKLIPASFKTDIDPSDFL